MRLPRAFADRVARRFHRLAMRRPPDFVVGGAESPYLRRWWLIPRNAVLNVYLHQFLRSDDERALHDHPWSSVSLILAGGYLEHTAAQDVSTRRRWFGPGAVIVRSPAAAHRIEIPPHGQAWTLFITGPRVREWGFHCPQGWRPWHAFVDPADRGSIGPGCD